VDVSYVIRTTQDRVGLYFLETGSSPRASQVIYDRAGSAFANFSSNELPQALFQPSRSAWLHVTGISLWLSDQSRAMIAHAVALAESAGWKVSFDVNHRSLLCSAESARRYCEPLVKSADLVFVPRRDAVNLWSLDPSRSDDEVLDRMMELRNGRPTVMTMGENGAVACDASIRIFKRVQVVEPIGRLGGGDAFSAGFLCAWLEGLGLERSLTWAVAAARMKYSIPGDLPIFNRAEIEKLVASEECTGTSAQSGLLVR
jgi:2-dehydro-3-deoxygluconokinase